MEQSILKSTKKVLQIGDDDASFDLDIMTHINSAFSDLHDLGVGPDEGFTIEDDTPVWDDFLSDTANKVMQNRAKTFIQLKVRLIFDPPATTFHLNAVQEQLKEVEWRLSVGREAVGWVDPDPPVVVIPDEIPDAPLPQDFDGGSA
jgi:hypothetical protein